MSEVVTLLRCPKCQAASPEDWWEYVEEAAYCELCGWHSGDRCPACGTVFDYGGNRSTVKRIPPHKYEPGPHHVMGPDGPVEIRIYFDAD